MKKTSLGRPSDVFIFPYSQPHASEWIAYCSRTARNMLANPLIP